MDIGTMIHLECKKQASSKSVKYYCKIIEKNQHYLFIDYPINEETNKVSYFPIGTYFSVTYIGEDQSVYRFRTKLISKVNLKIPALAIKLPNKKEIKRIQRREFVRVKSSVDAAVYSANNSFSPFTTVTYDISGGGMSIIIPKGMNLKLDENKDIHIWTVLEMYNRDFQYINLKAEFVHINKLENKLRIASLKFISIPRDVQQQIIRYCFEKQREARKKELNAF